MPLRGGSRCSWWDCQHHPGTEVYLRGSGAGASVDSRAKISKIQWPSKARRPRARSSFPNLPERLRTLHYTGAASGQESASKLHRASQSLSERGFQPGSKLLPTGTEFVRQFCIRADKTAWVSHQIACHEGQRLQRQRSEDHAPRSQASRRRVTGKVPHSTGTNAEAFTAPPALEDKIAYDKIAYAQDGLGYTEFACLR